MFQVKIRPATTSDLPTLLRFEQGVINAERPFDQLIKPDPVHYYDIKEMIRASHIELLVAEIDGQVVGSGYARIEKAKHFLKHPLHAYLGFMYVDPLFRGKGINSKIIQRLKEWAISQNISELRLDVYEGNEPAIKAYEKVGFCKQLINMHMEVGKG
ncbi:GNAT family N-acetyltransferase [Dyadobacter subterraneus]|uniref:GNAT family N-acetyltransferase n=1 Tax=Dyadobacter subterraneus TaxID=2773304 RepID=A0ABR9WA29_9BACT|nr:GNAT family N-acetyltransferase [Dyadobacter subterraneus]MBE9462338.1 GNAT family N-acetyltransferase [Dyadobacter subterraneus]